MLFNFTTVAVPLLASVTTTASILPVFPPPPVNVPTPFSIIKEFETKTAIREVAPDKTKEKRLICKGCNSYESFTLEFLQDKGIRDKNAIATIMGNIRQESTFVPNICEGGARVPYHQCRSGGYGAIQWTDSSRYYGLGKFAARIGGDPSTLDTQLQYIMYEGDWKMIENQMKSPGKSINDYMRLARKWVRWGHHGARTDFAYDYASRLIQVEV
ncbi:hypothetical protein EBU71_05350 [bacterium]|jgi:hypothetical protein|nr:hypothetical protein [Candidatus Elulimicrobium humile]